MPPRIEGRRTVALSDSDPTGPAYRTLLHEKLKQIYRLVHAEPAHAFVAFGDGHAIPVVSRESMLSRMDRWLKYDGKPLGGRDATPTPSP